MGRGHRNNPPDVAQLAEAAHLKCAGCGFESRRPDMTQRRTYYAPDNSGSGLTAVRASRAGTDVEKETAHKAIRTVCQHAEDADDARLLLEILGLTEHDHT